MKKWREYNGKISEYYGWATKELEKEWDASIISYNASGISLNKDEFFEFCTLQIQKEIGLCDALHVYLIVLEEVDNPNSKVERYKKCWKKISESAEIDYLLLGKEIEFCNNNKLYYASIARTQVQHLDRVLRLIDMKKQYRYLFLSPNDYLEKIDRNTMHLADYIPLNQFDEIDYPKVIGNCISNHDLACCYGSDSTGIELAIIFKKADNSKYIGEA